MSKTSMNEQHKRKRYLVKKAVLGFVIIVIALLFWIKVGIHIDKLTIGPYNVSGLYIKLDKKLVLTAHDVRIPVSKASPSLSNIDKTFDRLRGLLGLFEFVSLQDIIYKNNKIDFIYADNYLHINTKDYEIVGKLERKEKRFVGEVPLLHLKKQKLTLTGEFTYSHYEDRLHSWGTFETYGIKGKFVATKIKEKVHFDLQSDRFSDLEPLAMSLPLKDAIKVWPAKRVKAKEYKLLSLKGGGRIEGNTFKPDFGALKGEVELKDVRIDFKDEVDPVMAEQVNMQYRNGGLYFTLKHPTYQDKSIEGSKLAIVDLANKKPVTLKLDLKVDSLYDEGIQKIIKAYKLNIPVLQKTGKAKADVSLAVVLKNARTTAKIDVDLSDALVHVYKLDLAVEKGNVHYEDGIVSLNQVVLNDKIYSGLLNGKIDIKKEKAKFLMDAKYIRIKNGKEKFFTLKDKKIDIDLDYAKGINIHIPQFSLYLSEDKDKKLEIKVSDLSRIKPYINYKGMIQEGGSVEVTTNDLKKFTFKGLLHRSSCFFYEENDLCYTRVPVWGVVTPNNMELYAFDKRFYYNEKKGRITLDHLNIDLENLLKMRDAQISGGTNQQIIKKSIVILGKKSDLRYQQFTLKTDSYDVEIKPNGDIKAIGSTQGDIVKFEKTGENILINALRIKDQTLHPLINFRGLKDGRYSLKQSGSYEGVMKGKILIEGGVMKNFKVYNNVMALINTLPSLAVLQDPGFSTKGYKIENGVAEYRMIKDEKIIFDTISIKGTSSSIVGEGYIDLKKKTINIKLAIQTAKDFGKVVGKIPVLGYILMGKDKSMTIGLKVKGSLDKPEISTSAAADVLSLPLRLLKRTIESPTKIME
jgi:hypothetical protein